MGYAVYAPHKPEEKKLNEVVETMRELGSPTIRAFWSGDAYYAIEGSHRIAAAHLLGIDLEIEEIEEENIIEGHDAQDLSNGCTVAEMLEYFYSRPEAMYRFGE